MEINRMGQYIFRHRALLPGADAVYLSVRMAVKPI
jgi:hypothetical protein